MVIRVSENNGNSRLGGPSLTPEQTTFLWSVSLDSCCNGTTSGIPFRGKKKTIVADFDVFTFKISLKNAKNLGLASIEAHSKNRHFGAVVGHLCKDI